MTGPAPPRPDDQGRSPGRLRLIDLVILMSAVAVGLRLYLAIIHRPPGDPPWQPMIRGLIQGRTPVATAINGAYAAGSCLAIPLAVACPLAIAFGPRRRIAERLRRPGALACVLGSVLLALMMVNEEVQATYLRGWSGREVPDNATRYQIDAALASGSQAPLVVAVCWATLVAVRRWDRSADAVEWLARLVAGWWLLAFVTGNPVVQIVLGLVLGHQWDPYPPYE